MSGNQEGLGAKKQQHGLSPAQDHTVQQDLDHFQIDAIALDGQPRGQSG
jgi:hypothetical protein